MQENREEKGRYGERKGGNVGVAMTWKIQSKEERKKKGAWFELVKGQRLVGLWTSIVGGRCHRTASASANLRHCSGSERRQLQTQVCSRICAVWRIGFTFAATKSTLQRQNCLLLYSDI